MCRLCVEVRLMTQDEYESGNEPSNEVKKQRLDDIIAGNGPITAHELIELALVQVKREKHTVINIRNLAREVGYELTEEDQAAIDAEEDDGDFMEALMSAIMGGGMGGGNPFGAILGNGNIEVDDGNHQGEIPVEMAELITGKPISQTSPPGLRPTATMVDIPADADPEEYFASMIIDGLIHQLYANEVSVTTFVRVLQERAVTTEPGIGDKFDASVEVALIGALRLLSKAAAEARIDG